MKPAALEVGGKASVESMYLVSGCCAGWSETAVVRELASLLGHRRNVGWGGKAWGKGDGGRKIG